MAERENTVKGFKVFSISWEGERQTFKSVHFSLTSETEHDLLLLSSLELSVLSSIRSSGQKERKYEHFLNNNRTGGDFL